MLDRIDEEITFRKLEILLAFLEAGNLARAAERLGISAVSVHRALHSLETGTRCTLFRLEGRNLQPNDAAHALADVAREVLQSMANGIRATRDIAGYAADRIRIGSLYSLTSGTVPALIMGLRLRKPDIQAELVLGSNSDLLRKLREGALDATVMGSPEGASDVETQLLFEDDIFFAAPADSPYARESEIDLSACADERFVSLAEGYVTHDRFVDAFRVARFEPNVVMTTNDIFSLMNLVGGGIGCTLLPGRIRGVLPRSVCLIPLRPPYQMRQKISVVFLRTRERDPNLLSLLAAGRAYAAEFKA
ncbi:LysR family transcriptional regulator [Roseateles chitosanitabidus]|jgi:LysR family malonate utilization transcriptional regulator|uniref:LysR family transcriptional regulator n=1 Tax=Roseateles chitosanitabidus TaxID=65048 RepID=UPI00082C573E|nr:LysR family transcriptional regulator [Roseateles chitosanitabidus]MBO9687306.1 LysR family transcriptional regulator [Roseateles chitosanitabidus]